MDNLKSQWLCIVLAFICTISFNHATHAQSAVNYGTPSSQFSTNTTATLENMSSGTTQAIGANQINTSSAIIPFGFEVWFMGRRFTNFSVNTNGVLQFGTSVIDNAANTHAIATGDYRISPISSGTILGTETAPITGSFATSATGRVHYKLVGTAPNRYMVIEWRDVLLNHRSTTPTATFQAHIYETTPLTGFTTEGGRIYFVYGEMPTNFLDNTNTGTSATVQVGIGAGIGTNNFLGLQLDGVTTPTPTISDNDGVANSANYENSVATTSNVTLLHTTVPTSRRFINLEVDEVIGLPSNFRAVCITDNRIDLTWLDPGSSTAVGAVLYRSTDSVSFKFHAQVPLGTASYTDIGLTPGTTYYYNLYVVNEGKLSKLGATASVTATTGTVAKYSLASGDWNDPSIWAPVGVPTIANDVVINCNDIVGIGNDASCRNLQVTSTASLTFYDGGHTLAIVGNFTNEGSFQMFGADANVVLSGNLNNSGNWSSGSSSTFTLNGTTNQTITNTGTSTITTAINTISLGVTIGAIPDAGKNLATTPTNCNTAFFTNFFSGVASSTGTLTTTHTVLTKINVDITHPNNEDLEIWFRPPGAGSTSLNSYQLSSDNGGSGANYTNVTFSDYAQQSVATFSGVNQSFSNISLRPECQALSTIPFANSSAFHVYVNDDAAGNTGTFNSASATFETRANIADLSFFNLVINNTHTVGITLNNNIRISNILTLTDGVINTGTNEVIFIDNATTSDGSNASYVDGVVRKIGDDAFTFPVGDNNYFANIAITAPANTSDAFTAQYFHADPAGTAYNPNSKAVTLDKISACEYWILNRVSGASNVTVSLSYENTRSCGVGNSADLRVARWNAGDSEWKDHGNGGNTTVGGLNGILSNAAITTFSPFTLATTDPIGTPLPASLLNFDISKNSQGILAQWKTLDDNDIAYYQLQRSTNGIVFNDLKQKVFLKKTTTMVKQYSVWDKNIPKVFTDNVYYRLKVVEKNGAHFYSKTEALQLAQESYRIIHTAPNPFQDKLTVNYTVPLKQTVIIEIRNSMGKVIRTYTHKAEAGNNQLTLSKLDSLPKGSYLLILQHKNGKLTHTVIN